MMKKTPTLVLGMCLMIVPSLGMAQTQNVVGSSNKTAVVVSVNKDGDLIDPNIYGQMLEDCNDKVVYGGVVDIRGRENAAVTDLLKPLQIPVMRWPAGTMIYNYEWKKGIGQERRPEMEQIWGGIEYYTFGTDEFLQWCDRLDIEPYINIPMGNNNTYGHSLGEAIDWIEYTNGNPSTGMGAMRARNGHEAPYNVRYWCLGNENYLGCKFHKAENSTEYSALLSKWSSTLKSLYPDISILGVGHLKDWNEEVLETCGEHIDYLTLHYYYTSVVDDGQMAEPEKGLYSGELVEANIRLMSPDLDAYNTSYGRQDNPIRFSIDEWNNRHNVRTDKGNRFDRQDPRRVFDIPATATMLNVFCRNCRHIGMANYIFPVNGHGLVKTTSLGAYRSATYYVFELYRKYMHGRLAECSVTGPGLSDVRLADVASLSGDVNPLTLEEKKDLCYVDAAAAYHEDELVISLVSRSYDKAQKVDVCIPEGYKVVETITLGSNDVTDMNTEFRPDTIIPVITETAKTNLSLQPCGMALVICKKQQ